LRNNRLKFIKTVGKLLIISKRIYIIYPNLIKEKLKDVNMSEPTSWTCKHSDLNKLL
jgi:hypothetical protein